MTMKTELEAFTKELLSDLGDDAPGRNRTRFSKRSETARRGIPHDRPALSRAISSLQWS